jgi:predicted DNA-binding transcriptional regulator AlpA
MTRNLKLQTPRQTTAINIGTASADIYRGAQTTQSDKPKTASNDCVLLIAPDDRFIDEAERLRLTSVSQSTWYRWIHLGLAPEKYLIGPNTARNLLSEVQAWMAGRRSGWQNDRLNGTQPRQKKSA